jgi:small subunit ribosomal protein S6
MREYETVYIVRPDISDDDTDRLVDRVRSVIRNHDGKIVEINNWGKRRLAFEIAKQQKGIYFRWRYVSNNDCVAELERNLRLLDPVLRYLTIKLEDHVNADAYEDLGDEAIPRRVSGIEDFVRTPAETTAEGGDDQKAAEKSGEGKPEVKAALAKPEAKKPEAEKAEAKKPEAKKPEAKKPEAKKPEAEKAEAKKPEAKKPEAEKTAAKKAAAEKTEAKKAEAKKSEKTAPAADKPEADKTAKTAPAAEPMVD